MADANRKFLEAEFKRCLSACGFRGHVVESDGEYDVLVEELFTFRQLAKLSDLLGTPKIEIHPEAGRVRLVVMW